MTLIHLGGLDEPSASLAATGFPQGETNEPEDQTAIHRGEIGRPLNAGDVLTIELLESDQSDEPTVTRMLPEIDDES